MSNQLTEAKELNRQAAEKIKEYELLEEARRRGFVNGVRYKSPVMNSPEYTLLGLLRIGHNGNIYCQHDHGIIWKKDTEEWAEIIPEEDDIYLSLVQEKSLHDQIKEGGWEKVFEFYDPNSPDTLVTDLMFRIPDEEYFKLNAYYRLLALSKVLNEGKEDEGYLYVIKLYNKKFEINSFSLQVAMYPIYFYDQRDASFSLEFAEKEWKIFYNSNK